jgi:hypothetical protein
MVKWTGLFALAILLAACAPATTSLYQSLGNTLQTRTYSESGRYFMVLARPLLPYESPAGAEFPWQIPSPDVPTSTVEIACYPEDGVLTVP